MTHKRAKLVLSISRGDRIVPSALRKPSKSGSAERGLRSCREISRLPPPASLLSPFRIYRINQPPSSRSVDNAPKTTEQRNFRIKIIQPSRTGWKRWWKERIPGSFENKGFINAVTCWRGLLSFLSHLLPLTSSPPFFAFLLFLPLLFLLLLCRHCLCSRSMNIYIYISWRDSSNRGLLEFLTRVGKDREF